MAGATEKVVMQDANEAALKEFKEGVKRSIMQGDAGLVNTFKTKEEFLDHLKEISVKENRKGSCTYRMDGARAT